MVICFGGGSPADSQNLSFFWRERRLPCIAGLYAPAVNARTLRVTGVPWHARVCPQNPCDPQYTERVRSARRLDSMVSLGVPGLPSPVGAKARRSQFCRGTATTVVSPHTSSDTMALPISRRKPPALEVICWRRFCRGGTRRVHLRDRDLESPLERQPETAQ